MPRLTQLRTMLVANDLDETIAFYERLGFACVGTWTPPEHDDGKPVWCQLERDGVRLMFNHVGEAHDHGDGVLHVDLPEMSGSIYLDVDDVDALFEEIKTRHTEFAWEPADFPHGMREFALHDCNGYMIVFGTHLA
jgi:uncharacterized glyoxalase superfamily protein PhnB